MSMRALRPFLQTRTLFARNVSITPRVHVPRFLTIQAPGASTDLNPQQTEVPSIDASPTGSSRHPFAAVDPPAPPQSTTPTTHLPTPPEPLLGSTPPSIPHPFNTHAFFTYLESNGHTPQSSRSLMEAVRELIIWRRQQTRTAMVGREDMENQAYLFRAGLSELRTELSVRARNDGVTLKATSGAIRREVEGLEQKIKEDVQTLKHDIEMDMNNRKSETRIEMKSFDIAIEEINNKFTISLGDLRTEIESAKWDTTRRAITVIVTIVLFVIVMVTLSADTARSAPKAKAQPAPVAEPMRDMAVGTDDEDEFVVDEDTEKKLEQLLASRKVEIPVKRLQPVRSAAIRDEGHRI